MASHDAARALTGKVALVTGAGRGLGRAFAEGWRPRRHVAMHGMREHGPAEYGEGTDADGGRRAVGAAHASAPSACSAISPKARNRPRRRGAREALGPIDILVHNAGGDIAAGGGKPNPNDAVNIKEGRARGARPQSALHHPDLPGGGARHDGAAAGRIVTIGSVAAFKGRTDGSIYAVAKAGMTHYTRCLADQLRPYDITVNCIAPGDTRTGRFLGTRAVDRTAGRTGTLDRIATVDEVARVVEFFAGPQAPSSPARCCGSTAAASAGRGEGGGATCGWTGSQRIYCRRSAHIAHGL